MFSGRPAAEVRVYWRAGGLDCGRIKCMHPGRSGGNSGWVSNAIVTIVIIEKDFVQWKLDRWGWSRAVLSGVDRSSFTSSMYIESSDLFL